MSAVPADFPEAYRVSDPVDPYETTTGLFYEPVDHGGDPRVVLLVDERHCNSSGVTHGGLLMTMADLTLCAAAREGLPGERAITVSFDSHFISSGELGDFLVARARVTRRGGTLVFVQGEITVGDRVLLTCNAVTRRVKRDRGE
jgi:uncharacterized protein (TIGR00369 family)